MGIVLRTPLGTVVHTGDFKIDHTPVDGMPTSLGALASHCAGGTLLLMSDSTYAELPGYTPSERVVGEALQRVIAEADGRVLVATFASLISRIQQVFSAAVDSGRHVAIVGRSMVDNVNMSMQMGYISVPDGLLVSVDEARGMDADRVVLMTTGSQGEPTSALARIANQNHREISIMPGDTVVISATPIPGNELSVSRIIDNLFRQGATVLYDRVALVHVHGHASAEELKLILNLTAPSYFVPIHGEYRHLLAHASLARDVGIPDQNLFVLEDGDILELDEEGGRVVGSVPAGHVFVEGNTLWSADSPVLSERWRLSRDGVMIVTMQIDDYTGLLAGTPEIVSRGVVKPVDLAHLAERVSAAVDDLLEKAPKDPEVWANTKAKLDQLVGDLVYKETGRRPMIVVTASEAL
jgi:ribonuclease J